MFIFIQVKYIYFYSFHSEYPVTTKALKIGGGMILVPLFEV